MRNRILNISLRKSIIYWVAAFFFFVMAVFCIFFITTGYLHLRDGYYQLNDCFYRSWDWSRNFFNSETKHRGDFYCLVLLLVYLGCFIYSVIRIRRRKNSDIHIQIEASYWSAGYVIILLSILFGLWMLSNKITSYGYDEIFSAVNCASIPSAQTLTYYMLPNNHIFFNLVNGLSFWTKDKVHSGRIISLVCYLANAILIYLFVSKQLNNRFAAFFISLAASMALPVWGFASQARGYEMELACCWLAFLTFSYYIEIRRRLYLALYILAIALGYAVMPSMLFFHTAFLLYIIYAALVGRKIDRPLVIAQLIIVLLVASFYLPGVCFSGLKSFIGNDYVAPMGISTIEFLKWMWPMYKDYPGLGFGHYRIAGEQVSIYLAIVPLFLFFSGRKQLRTTVLLYLFLILSFLLVSTYMKRPPFYRNMIGQMSIMFVLTMMTFYVGVRSLIKRKWGIIPAIAPACIFIVYFFHHNPDRFSFDLYLYDENPEYKELEDAVKQIPEGATVGLSDESFYTYYAVRNRDCTVDKCILGKEDFIIRTNEERIDSTGYIPDFHFLHFEVLKKVPAPH